MKKILGYTVVIILLIIAFYGDSQIAKENPKDRDFSSIQEAININE